MSNSLRKIRRRSLKRKVTIDFNTDLLDLKNESMGATLKVVCVNALANPIQGDEREEPKTKYEWFKLAKKIEDATAPLDITAEEVTLLKGRISKLYGVVVFGRAADILEGRTEESETPDE